MARDATPVAGPGSDIQGRAALVTGASKRIGRAIALELARRGCHVAVHHRASTAQAQEVAAAARAFGVRACVVQADLADAGARSRLLAESREGLGQDVTLLVNNASAFPRATVEGLDEAGLLGAVQVNAWAPFDLMRQLHAAGGRAAVNLLDARLHDAEPDRIGYHVSKVALRELTLLAARSFAPALRVNGVAPGPVLAHVDAGPSGAPPSTKALPLAARPSAEGVAQAVVFLLEARDVTGCVIPVDGGRHLVGPAPRP